MSRCDGIATIVFGIGFLPRLFERHCQREEQLLTNGAELILCAQHATLGSKLGIRSVSADQILSTITYRFLFK